MPPGLNLAPPARQRGWVGIVMILVAIVIVAILAKEALKGYGLASGGAATRSAGTPAERARAAGAGGIEALDLGSAPEVPASTLERARGVEDMLKQQANERDARMESQTK